MNGRLQHGMSHRSVLIQPVAEVSPDYCEAIVELPVVVDDEITIINIGLDIPLECRQDMVLIPVKDVIERIIPFDLVTTDPADDLQVFFGVQEDTDIQ